MASMAGSKGGFHKETFSDIRIIPGLNKKLFSLWTDYGTSKISLSQFASEICNMRRLREVSIDINFECNFSCAYCSYGFSRLHKEELTINEWKKVIDDCVENGVKLFALAGKEPLINDRFRDILLYIKAVKENKGLDLITGLITNGWFLKDRVEQLVDTGLNYLDVSIDGPKDIHSKNRKSDSFNRAIEGLLAARDKCVAKAFFVSSVLHAQNYRVLPYFIKELYSKGIKHFCLSLLYPVSAVPREILFQGDELKVFFKDILPGVISDIPDASDLQIVVDIFTSCIPQLKEMVFDKTINIDNVCTDDIDSLYTIDELPNGCKLYKRFSLDHLTYGKAIKVTADGYCMTDYRSLTKPDYWKYSVGNIKDRPVSSTYSRLFEENSYLFNLAKHIDHNACAVEPCYPLCLGQNCQLSNKGEIYDNFLA